MATDDLDPEDSMEEISLEEDQKEEYLPYKKDFDQVDSMLAQMININNSKALHEPTCVICSSKLRADAEDSWDKNRRTALIVEMFKKQANINIGRDVVVNHMDYHKDRGVQEIHKVEYVDRIRRLYGKNVTTLDRLDLCLAVLTERLMQINSLAPNHEKSAPEIEKIKSSETVKLMGTYGNLLKLQATILGEMKDNGEIITIPRQRFVEVFNLAITSARNDREREIIKSILDGLKGN